MIKSIGAEVEFPLSKKGIPQVATKYNLPHDDFALLVELRTIAGSPGQVYGDFLDKYNKVLNICEENKLKLHKDLFSISTEKYWEYVGEFIREGYGKGGKDNENKGKAGNIYGNKIKHMPIEDKIHRGGGIHIHFSLHENFNTSIYESTGFKKIETSKKYITFPKLCKNEIIKRMDNIFNEYTSEEEKKNTYRQPGFWRDKQWGFEYRSLGTNQRTIKDLYKILNSAWNIFEEIV